MKKFLRSAVFYWLGAVLLGGLSPKMSLACGIAPPPGMRVGVAGEEALIVWNQATHTEQFIRRASFVGQAPQFGFLVPTPTPPKLSEADSRIFDTLASTYHPRLLPQPEHGLKLISITGIFFPTFAGGHGRAFATAAIERQRVSVLDSEQVAGYDAVVLRADDSAALTRWLGQHGYDARPAMMAWLQPYVARHWAITAFKLAKPDFDQPTLASPTVRMTFTTDRPFYPYSEPADQRVGQQTSASRLLRVYCVSNTRMDGVLDSPTVRWPGQARWAESLPPAYRDQIAGSVMNFLGDQIPPARWLTVFEDKSSPRPGVADLYFVPAKQQNPLVATVYWPQDQRLGIPVELILAGVIVGANRLKKHRADRSHNQA